MHKKRELSILTWSICLLISGAAHLLLLPGELWQTDSCAAQILLQQGESAVELTLLPCVARVATPPKPEPPVPQPKEEPPPAPIIEKPSELNIPKPEEEKPPEIEPEQPQVQTVEQDATLKQKGVSTRTQRIRSCKPVYPRISRRRGEEGTVIIALTVTAKKTSNPPARKRTIWSFWKPERTTGTATNIHIVKSSGFPLLDKTALNAVKKCRFKPATQNGKPIDSMIEQEFIFRLEDE